MRRSISLASKPHILLSAFGSAVTLIAWLLLPRWYEVEIIGVYGVLLAWIGVFGIVSNAKLYSKAILTTNLDLSHGLILGSILLSITFSFFVGLTLIVLDTIFAVQTLFFNNSYILPGTVGIAAIGVGQPLVARLQRDGSLIQLGLSRFIRGVTFLVLLFILSDGGVRELLFAFGGSQLLGGLVMVPGLTINNFDWPSKQDCQSSFYVTGSSLSILLSEVVRLQLLYIWLPPVLLGQIVYLIRLIKGAHLWPGQVFCDLNLSTFAKTEEFDKVKPQLIQQVILTSIVGAGAALIGLNFLSSSFPSYIELLAWFLVLLIEGGLIIYLILLRPFPALMNGSGSQFKNEWLGLCLSVLSMMFIVNYMAPSPYTYLMSICVPGVFLIYKYQDILGNKIII